METFSNKQNLREFTAGRHLKEAPKCMYFRKKENANKKEDSGCRK